MSETDFRCFIIEVALNFKLQGNQKIELSSPGTYDTQNWKIKNLSIADYEYIKSFSLALLEVKLWLKEYSTLHEVCTFNSMNMKDDQASSFSHNFTSYETKLTI